jgi:hypothetical protein
MVLCDARLTMFDSCTCDNPAVWVLSYFDLDNPIYRCELSSTSLENLACALHIPSGEVFSETEISQLIRLHWYR